MFTRTRKNLVAVAAIALVMTGIVIPSVASAEESDYDYWAKGATTGHASRVDPAYYGQGSAGRQQAQNHYPQRHPNPTGRSYEPDPRFFPSHANTRGWTYDYD